MGGSNIRISCGMWWFWTPGEPSPAKPKRSATRLGRRVVFDGETSLLEECPTLLLIALQRSNSAFAAEVVMRLRRDADDRQRENWLVAQREWCELADEVKTAFAETWERRARVSEEKMWERIAQRRNEKEEIAVCPKSIRRCFRQRRLYSFLSRSRIEGHAS